MIRIDIRHWPFVQWQREATNSDALGWIALVITVLAAGTYNGFAKVLSTALSPFALVFISEILTGFFVLFSFGAMPMMQRLMRIKREMVVPLLIVGFCSGTIAPLLLFTGLKGSSAVNASLFNSGEMVFLIIFAVLLLRERFTKVHMLSISVIIAGMAIIALRGFSENFVFRMGDVLLILANIFYAIGSITFRRFLHSEPQLTIFVRSLTSVTFFFVYSTIVGPSLTADIALFPIALIGSLLGFAFISRFLNVFSFYESLDRLPVTTVSLFCNLTAIVSIFFAHWYTGEHIHGYHLLGGSFIILGALMLEVLGVHPSVEHHEVHLEQKQPHR